MRRNRNQPGTGKRLSRRSFLKRGAAALVGSLTLSHCSEAPSPCNEPPPEADNHGAGSPSRQHSLVLTGEMRVFWPGFKKIMFQYPDILKASIAEQAGCQPDEVILFEDGETREIYIPSTEAPGEFDRVVLTL